MPRLQLINNVGEMSQNIKGILGEAVGDVSSSQPSSKFSSVNRHDGLRAEIIEEDEKLKIEPWEETNLFDGLNMKHVDDE